MSKDYFVNTATGALDGLLAAIVDDTSSRLSLSWYDTARVLSLWSRRPGGMPGRLADAATGALIAGQNPDGSWGYPQAAVTYRLAPTMAAVKTLSELGRAVPASRGLAFLARHLEYFAPERQPDTVAVELIQPDLLEALVADGATVLMPALDRQREWLVRLHDLRRRAVAGERLPLPLWHSLEVLGPAAIGLPGLSGGAMTCSPAATAALLAWSPAPLADAEAFLTAEAARYDGGWPTVAPVRFFEGAWVVGAMAQGAAPIGPRLAGRLRAWLTTSLRPEGAIPGPGLPPDADDTARILYALSSLGARPDLSLLDRYERDDRYTTFSVERTASISTNAHVLRAVRGDERRSAAARTYLFDTQNQDGFWADKWHASPYYATSASVLALAGDPAATDRVRRTAAWLAGSQRPDGSWGVWHGTYEETAYAVRALLAAGTAESAEALRRGAGYLADGVRDGLPRSGRATLWHGKELYEPWRITSGYIYSAVHACARAGLLEASAQRHEDAHQR
ncbi:hypothetical protein [Actinoplanes sp. NPDC026623]|uniref:hypothetical protein n=1 Tax=Actinoplanes sp. NPDC026623 TaxID=3155610 RepID=UPI0033EEA592